jgi:L-threonylcarbamoyladenylate synthase
MLKLTEKDIEISAKVLQNGEILAFPTETVYGVGVVYDNENAFKKLVNLKKRPPNKPFALMCSSMKQAFEYIDVSEKAKAVMDKFLPGELTVLVHAKKDLPEWVTLGTGIIGIRVPDSPFVDGLIEKVGKPCLVTSANRSGEPTSRFYDEVLKIFDNEVGGIVKGECCSLTPTTIVNLTKDDEISLVREGPIPFEQIESYWRSIK